MTNNVLSQITALRGMNTSQLHHRWKELFGDRPSQSSRSYLQRRLAYRIQELAFGGDPTINKRLEAFSKQQRNERKRRSHHLQPLAGTRLVREYKGVEHHVTVMAGGGFEYQGRKYTSLTRLACDITGTWISGPAFFGLSPKKKKGGAA